MMKASLVYVICLILFLLPLSADDSVKLPVEEIRRQMSIFGAANSADTKIQAASLLARLIQADGREEEYDRMFRKQAEDDPSATKPLLALSECMHVWGCTAESVKLLTEATKRQPSDVALQALLAERLDQSGEPNKAAPIFASLVAEHRSPELLRRYAAFLFRTGDIDQGSTIASQLVMEAKNGREPEALAQELLSQQEWTYTRDFLSLLLTRFPNDWRLAYLHAYALARIAPDIKAFAEFLALTKNHEEIPDLFSSINAVERFPLSDPAVLQKILSSLSPEDALLFRYLATAQTASPVESNRQTEFVGGRSDMNPEALLPFLTLPSTVLDLRLYALRHCFAIASGLPIAQRSELLAEIQAPDFPFIDRMKNAAMVNLEASSSVFRPVAAMDLSSFTPIGERAMKSKEMSNAIQAAMVVSDYTTAVDLANQSIKLPASFFSNNFRIPSYADRSQHLYRISNKPTITFTPDYISGMFGVSNLARSFAPTSLRPPLPSPTHVELLKILGETFTASSDAPPFFRITDSEKFLAAVAKIDSPFQRVLILYACDMKEALLQNLTDLTKDGATPDGEILFWASAYYANEGSNLSIAYELAIRARAALDPIHHAAADAQLVTLGLLLQGDRKTTPDLSAAKSAALEFSRFAVEESSRKELAGVFKSFGLNEAAAQLAQPHLIGAARLRAISMYRKSSQDVAAAATPTERPAALRRLYRVLRTMLRFDLLDRSSYFSPNTFIQSVQELHLVPDLAATMFPPPGSSYERRQEYAIIMAKLDDVIKVMPLLETLHSERPSDTAILSLLCVASPMPRRLELFDLLCQSSEDDLSDFADAIIPMLHTQGVTDSDVFRKIFADWRSIAVLLARIPPEKSNSKNLTWLNEPATRFFVDCPSYHEPVGPAENQQDTPAAKEAAILAKLHDAVAKEVAISMLKHAATAAYGFTLLAAGKSTFGVDDRAMLAMAKDAYRVKLSAVDFHAPYPTRRYVSYSRGGHFSGFPTSSVNLDWHTNTPFRHLLAQTSASNTFYQISDFLPSLPEPAKSELKAWLDYFTTPSPAAAIALLATLSRERYLGKSENILTLALEITALCNLDPSPGLGMLVEQVEVTAKAETSHYYYDSSRVILLMQTIYSHFQSRNKNDAVTPLLTKAIARVLGPASCWPLYAKVLGENASNDSSIRQRHQTFTSLLILIRFQDKVFNPRPCTDTFDFLRISC
jgi:hypothetical protein